MKTKIFTLLTTLALITTFAIPAFAASSSYSFTMDLRVVDGKKTGSFHSLDKGDAKISGSSWIYSRDQGYVTPAGGVSYQLCRSKAFFDKCYGTVNGGVGKDFTGTYKDLDENSDKYYLIIFKTADDGNNVKGSGKITQ